MADFYEILAVPRTASAADIRKAYTVVAREQHPDRFADPAEKARAQEFFQKATEAFNTLFNDRTRAQYDAEVSKPKLETPAEVAADAFARAQKQMEARDLDGAIELLRAAVYHMPAEARYHAALGRLLVRHPKTAREGVVSLEEAARLAPRDAHIQADLAIVLEGQGLHIRARKAAETARSLAPDDPQVAKVAAQLGIGGGDDAPPEPGGLRGFLRRKS
jgi:tetratricopeptide (TPR) repeat protein